MKVRDVVRLIEEDGWYQVATKGSHRQFKHDSKPGRVTIVFPLPSRISSKNPLFHSRRELEQFRALGWFPPRRETMSDCSLKDN